MSEATLLKTGARPVLRFERHLQLLQHRASVGFGRNLGGPHRQSHRQDFQQVGPNHLPAERITSRRGLTQNGAPRLRRRRAGDATPRYIT